MHDLPAPHIEGTHYRRESAAKPKEMKPLLTREPLPHDREKKPPAPPQKKRKRALPTTPLFTFDPTHSNVPSGKQDPPASPLVVSGPPAPESLTSPYDEQQTTPFIDRGIHHSQSYDGYDTQKRPRIFSECPSVEHSTSFYPDTPCTDASDISSVPPPAPSDQSLCAAEYVAYARQVQPPLIMYPYVSQGYGQPPVIHQEPYGYSMDPCQDRPAQGYPVQHFDAAHGRAGPHGIPAYPESHVYPFPPRRY